MTINSYSSGACTDDVQEFTGEFDAVVMLTWSNWHKEPRSNRYHYASRFSKCLPVLFLQPTLVAGAMLSVEPSGLDNLDVVNVSQVLDENLAAEVRQLLRARGIRRPLLWIYSSTHYSHLIAALPNAFRVYHATEDYLTPSSQWGAGQSYITATVRKLLAGVDLLVAVSPSVLESYLELGGFVGPALVAENGCDASFFENLFNLAAGNHEAQVAIFQGGINRRVDFGMLLQLVRRLDSWTFWFCGQEEKDLPLWDELRKEPNVKYFGALEPAEFGAKMCAATVGIIPFVEDPMIWNSLPLKAYEYVACSLPVVTVPIAALSDQPSLFETASGAVDFADAILRVAPSRDDPDAIAKRLEVARLNSYDSRFSKVVHAINLALASKKSIPRKLNVAILYDDASVHVNTIREHLESFRRYSHHQIFYLPATDAGAEPNFTTAHVLDGKATYKSADLSFFDVIVVHYSVRLSLRGHLNETLAKACQGFAGTKILYIQDEYDSPEIARGWMDKLGFDLVYTCVPSAEVQKVYPMARFPATEFLPTLTGYVPENPMLDSYALPLSQRRLAIGYRGRKLPLIYGELGYEKYWIGLEMKRLAAMRGLEFDIQVDDLHRIYGVNWYKFMGSVRATLGTESGCNIFDFDGTVADAIDAELAKNPDVTYPELKEKFLGGHDGLIKMNQISPKIFEAIRTRTVLILFEGDYSGVVKPNVHFIPLKKDFSNVDEVFAKIEDDDLMEQIADRAYRDVIQSGRFGYRTFVAGFDADLDVRVRRGPRVEIYATPILGLAPDGTASVMIPHAAGGYFLSTGVLERRSSRGVFSLQVSQYLESSFQSRLLGDAGDSKAGALFWRAIRKIWPRVPSRVRTAVRHRLHEFERQYYRAESERSVVAKVASSVWRLMPSGAKQRIRALLGR